MFAFVLCVGLRFVVFDVLLFVLFGCCFVCVLCSVWLCCFVAFVRGGVLEFVSSSCCFVVCVCCGLLFNCVLSYLLLFDCLFVFGHFCVLCDVV